MNITLFSIIAILLYLAAGISVGRQILLPEDNSRAKLPFMAVGGLALLFHALVLYHTIVTGNGLNLGFYHALSLMGWMVALLVIVMGFGRPTENLSLVFLPAAAICLLLELLLPGERLLVDSAVIGLDIHILLSITAYSLLAMASVQAIVLAIQERQLHNKHPLRVMRMFPPLQTMEELLVQLLAIGFFLLSLSLATGLMFVHDIFGQHLSHKIFWAVLAWFIFGLLLLGRWARGWRGKILIGWTLGGFTFLVLSYFGSKLVLELILHRV